MKEDFVMKKLTRPMKLLIVGIVLIAASLIPYYWSESLRSQQVVVRAAIDIGSGSTKLRVAEVNPVTNRIVRLLENRQFTVLYQEDLEANPDHEFTKKVMDTGLEAIQTSVEIAKKHEAEKVIAIATAAFRKAENSEKYIQRIFDESNVKVFVIDQNLEGKLAFEAALSRLNIRPSNLIVWDIGGGSLQLTTMNTGGEYEIYRGHEAVVPFKNYVMREIQKKDPMKASTPNPMNWLEIQEAEEHARSLAQKVDAVFKKKILKKGTQVVGVGSVFEYGIIPLVKDKNPFTLKDITTSLHELVGKTDEELGGGDFSNVFVTNGILIIGFMEELHIEKIQVLDVNNADGAMLYEPFWSTSKTTETEE